MGPAWSSVSPVLWLLSALAAAAADPAPQYSIPSLVWYSVPVSAVPAVPLLQLVDPVPAVATAAASEPAPVPATVTARKVISPAASDNTLGVTVAKQRQPGCPYCDSSVYPYCSDKLLHDACCCLDPYSTVLMYYRKVISPAASDNTLGVTVAKQRQPGCPYCDSSVYPYCSDKLLHDACCCLDPYVQALPPQCQLADCSFLHANSCKEHRLITRCCCDRLLYIKR